MSTPVPTGEEPVFDDLTHVSEEEQIKKLQTLQDRFNGRDGVVPHHRVVRNVALCYDYLVGWLERRNLDVLVEGMTYTKFERELIMRERMEGQESGLRLVPDPEPSSAYKLYRLVLRSLDMMELSSATVNEVIGGVEFHAHFGQLAFATLPKN